MLRRRVGGTIRAYALFELLNIPTAETGEAGEIPRTRHRIPDIHSAIVGFKLT